MCIDYKKYKAIFMRIQQNFKIDKKKIGAKKSPAEAGNVFLNFELIDLLADFAD